MKYNSDFRYDLMTGERGESDFGDLFSEYTKFEIKTDFHTHKTGNIAIEYKSRNKLSGINTTESDYYVYLVPSAPVKNIMVIIPINELKELTKKKAKEGSIKKGGDSNTSDMVLIPISELFLK